MVTQEERQEDKERTSCKYYFYKSASRPSATSPRISRALSKAFPDSPRTALERPEMLDEEYVLACCVPPPKIEDKHPRIESRRKTNEHRGVIVWTPSPPPIVHPKSPPLSPRPVPPAFPVWSWRPVEAPGGRELPDIFRRIFLRDAGGGIWARGSNTYPPDRSRGASWPGCPQRIKNLHSGGRTSILDEKTTRTEEKTSRMEVESPFWRSLILWVRGPPTL